MDQPTQTPDPRPPRRAGPAAAFLLGPQLQAVADYLPLAAEHARDDVEHVHRLRVAVRRAVAALALFEEMVTPRQVRRLKRRLRAIRRAAGAARDCDVLRARWECEHLAARAPQVLDILAEERAAAQVPLLAAHERMQNGAYERRCERLLGRLHVSRRAAARKSLRQFARQVAKSHARRFVRAGARVTAEISSLHRLRIEGKRLRYALDLLRSALPARRLAEVLRRLTLLQDRLGAINDHATALARLRGWLDRNFDSATHDVLAELALQEESALERAVAEFELWWSEKRRDKWRRRLARLTAKSPK